MAFVSKKYFDIIQLKKHFALFLILIIFLKNEYLSRKQHNMLIL